MADALDQRGISLVVGQLARQVAGRRGQADDGLGDESVGRRMQIDESGIEG